MKKISYLFIRDIYVSCVQQKILLYEYPDPKTESGSYTALPGEPILTPRQTLFVYALAGYGRLTRVAKYILSHKYYTFEGKIGELTRLAGVPRENCKALILEHLKKNTGYLHDLKADVRQVPGIKYLIVSLTQRMAYFQKSTFIKVSSLSCMIDTTDKLFYHNHHKSLRA